MSEGDREMKAILVIDMPKDCWDCHLVSEFHSCRGTVLQNDFSFRNINNFDKGERPSWCPLKPMPERKDTSDRKITYEELKERYGWNDCLKEIENA